MLSESPGERARGSTLARFIGKLYLKGDTPHKQNMIGAELLYQNVKVYLGLLIFRKMTSVFLKSLS